MSKLVENQHNFIADAFQSAFGNEDFLFQIVNYFPMPIAVFVPDGVCIFANSTFLEVFHIADPDQIMGRLNLLKASYVNDELGLREYLARVFGGEALSVQDIKVPFSEIASRYKVRENKLGIASIHQDIHCFPIRDKSDKIAYIAAVFIIKKIYEGQPDIARAKEYMETHWFEEFEMDKVARAVNLSRYHFARMFKKHVSMTPYSYYQEVKVKKLKETLRDKSLSIAEAFSACGVDYNGNYARLFKEKAGMTPSQYRKSVL